jgi:hypothetical protein
MSNCDPYIVTTDRNGHISAKLNPLWCSEEDGGEPPYELNWQEDK